jgi:hypothetical protein
MKSSNGVAGAACASGFATSEGSIMMQEFHQGFKQDKAHYDTLKKDEGFRDWNHGFIATARMHHIYILYEHYIPLDDITSAAFKEMHIFM